MSDFRKTLEALLADKSTNLTRADRATGQKLIRMSAEREDDENEKPKAEDDEEAKAKAEEDEADKTKAEDDETDKAKAEGDETDKTKAEDDKTDKAKAEEDDEDPQARIFAILESPEAEGRADLAKELAKNKALSAKAAIKLLKFAPKTTAHLDNIRQNSPSAVGATGGNGSPMAGGIVAAAEALAASRQ